MISFDENWDEIKKAIMNIEKRCFDKNIRQSAEELGRSFNNEDGICMTYRKDGKVVGYLTSWPEDEYFEHGDEDTLYIESWAVLPEERGKGIGKLFLKIVEQEAKKRGYDFISGNFIQQYPEGFEEVDDLRFQLYQEPCYAVKEI